jgi:poly(3-hydroxybutyrate) depolymerase
LQYTGFVAMNPDRHATSHYDYFKDLIKGDDASAEAHRKFYDEYNAVLDMDADYYLETIATVFQDFKLVNGTWDVKGVDGKVERVRPQDIKGTALMTVEGELDDISGSGQTRAAQDMCTGVAANDRLHLEVPGAGHYGIFSGSRWRNVVYPQVVKFILSHTKTDVKTASATPKAAASAAVKPVQAKTVTAKPAVKAPVKVAAKPAAPKAVAKPAAKAPVKAAASSKAKVLAKPAAKASTPAVKTSWVEPKKKA